LEIFGAKQQGKAGATKKDDGSAWNPFATAPDAKLVKPPAPNSAEAAWNPFAAPDAKPGETKKDAGGGGGWFGAPAAADTKVGILNPNHQPYPLNNKPSTLNPTTSTLKPNPSSQLSTLNPQS